MFILWLLPVMRNEQHIIGSEEVATPLLEEGGLDG